MSHSPASASQAAVRPLTACGARALSGRLRVPGDKSISHRALIFGALASGTTVVEGLLASEDVLNTAAALRALGVPIEVADDKYTIFGRGVGGLSSPVDALDFGNSGTGARLMMGVVAGNGVSARFTGDASLSRRPMGRVLDPLKAMGLEIVAGGPTTLPLTLRGPDRTVPISYRLPVPSAQVKSAILLAGLGAPGRTIVIEPEATRDHTERMLEYFGARLEITQLDDGARQIALNGDAELSGRPVYVPSDPSSAAFLAAAAAIVPGSDVVIEGVLLNPTRDGFYRTLRDMGGDVSYENERDAAGERIADIRVRCRPLRGVNVPSDRAPSMIDEYPILSVVAAFATGPTRMDGLGELRVKESDRLEVTAAGLRANGVQVQTGADWLEVAGGGGAVEGGGTVATDLDHRIAMAFLVMGLATRQPVTVDDTAMIATSFPDFRALVETAGGRFSADSV